MFTKTTKMIIFKVDPAPRTGPLSRPRGDPGLTPHFFFPQDIITDDEILSDSYGLKEVDGIVYEADCAMITEAGVEVGSSLPFGAWNGAPSEGGRG